MDAIIAQNRREIGDTITEADPIRAAASGALEKYLSLPMSKAHEGTYAFWRDYKMTTDQAQKQLCNLARIHLTPPPTSTGMLNPFNLMIDLANNM